MLNAIKNYSFKKVSVNYYKAKLRNATVKKGRMKQKNFAFPVNREKGCARSKCPRWEVEIIEISSFMEGYKFSLCLRIFFKLPERIVWGAFRLIVNIEFGIFDYQQSSWKLSRFRILQGIVLKNTNLRILIKDKSVCMGNSTVLGRESRTFHDIWGKVGRLPTVW